MDFNLSKEQQMILLGLVVAMVVGLAVMFFRNYFSGSSDGMVIEEPKKLSNSCPTSVMVHVTGAVRREGVYRLNFGDRVLEAVKLAGGPKPEADLSAINLAELVKDG
ncbi:MAG: SLBB domain-containing protein, partial [Candidatus Margulisiibacteriota bacterium]